MYCITIKKGKQDIEQLYYHSEKLAKERQEQILLNKLYSFLYFEEEELKVGDIKISILESLVRSLIKKQYKFNHDKENDVDEYYDNHKFEVSLLLLSFEDEQN